MGKPAFSREFKTTFVPNALGEVVSKRELMRHAA